MKTSLVFLQQQSKMKRQRERDEPILNICCSSNSPFLLLRKELNVCFQFVSLRRSNVFKHPLWTLTGRENSRSACLTFQTFRCWFEPVAGWSSAGGSLDPQQVWTLQLLKDPETAKLILDQCWKKKKTAFLLVSLT